MDLQELGFLKRKGQSQLYQSSKTGIVLPTKNALKLNTREIFRDTPVVGIPETERLFGSPLSVDVECIRVRKDVLVAVCGLVGGNDTFAGFDNLQGGNRFVWLINTCDCRKAIPREQDMKYQSYLPAQRDIHLGNSASCKG